MPSGAPSKLQRNMQVLARREPKLHERITWPVESKHVEALPGKPARYKIHRTWYALSVSPENVEKSLEGIQPGDDVFLFGIGIGEQLNALLARGHRGHITAWERDPWLLRTVLSLHDYTRALGTGKLHFKLCGDLVAEIPKREGRKTVLHPFLHRVYRHEKTAYDRGLPEKRAFLCFGTLFVDDVADALRALGYGVLIWDVWRLSVEEQAFYAAQYKPDWVFGINLVHRLSDFCRQLGVPYSVWEIDPATDNLVPPKGPTTHTRIHTYRRANIETLRKAGYANVEYLPLGTSPETRYPIDLKTAVSDADRARYTAAVSFVGSSQLDQADLARQKIVDAWLAWKNRADDATREEIQSILDAILLGQRQDYARYLLPSLVEGEFAEFLRYESTKDYDMLVVLAEIASAEKRNTYIANLGQVGCKVWGDEGWKLTERYGAKYMGPADHKRDLNRVYSGTAINIDVGRIYQSDIVTMRVFDVLACGGFLLTERNDALSELFKVGEELDAYGTLEELLGKVEHYMAHPEEARAIAERGRAAVLERHTIRSRVQHMLEAGQSERMSRPT